MILVESDLYGSIPPAYTNYWLLGDELVMDQPIHPTNQTAK
jgi:hypothetical protein